MLFLIAFMLDFTSVLGHLSVIMTSDSATAPAVFVASLLDADRYRKKGWISSKRRKPLAILYGVVPQQRSILYTCLRRV